MLVKDYHVDKVTSGGVTCQKYLFGISSAFFNLAESPGNGSGRIVDGLLDGSFGQQTVTDPDHTHSAVLKLRGNLLVPSLDTSSMEPYYCRIVLYVLRMIEVQQAAFTGIFTGIGLTIRYVPFCHVCDLRPAVLGGCR